MASVNLDAVQAFMKKQNYSEFDLSKAMGVSYSYVFRVMRGKRSPGGKFIEGLLRAGMSPGDIFLPSSLPKVNTGTEG